MPQNDWRHHAACLDEDPELFFPTAEPGTTAHTAQQAEAIKVCARCPVAAECAALGANLDDGVYGGMPEKRARHYNRTAAVAA